MTRKVSATYLPPIHGCLSSRQSSPLPEEVHFVSLPLPAALSPSTASRSSRWSKIEIGATEASPQSSHSMPGVQSETARTAFPRGARLHTKNSHERTIWGIPAVRACRKGSPDRQQGPPPPPSAWSSPSL